MTTASKPSSAQDNSKWIETDNAIRALTTIINRLHKQVDPPTRTPKRHDSILATCNYIATLLTQGKRENNLQVVAGKRVIAVSVKVAHDRIHLVTTESSESNNDADIVTSPVQDPDRRQTQKFDIEPVLSSGKSLTELRTTAPVLEVPLRDHLADVLAAVSDRGAYTSVTEKINFMLHFIYRRCIFKVNHRLHMDRHVFNAGLDDILRDWAPRADDIIDEVSVHIKRESLRIILNDFEVSYTTEGGRYFYKWSGDTAKGWIAALVTILERAKNMVDAAAGVAAKVLHVVNGPTESAKASIDASFLAAISFMSILHDLIHLHIDFFAVQSLEDLLQSHRKHASRYAGAADHFDGADDSELNQEPDESAASLAMRFLRNSVAWHDATHFILRNKALTQSTSPLDVTLVHTPSHDPDAIGSIHLILKSAIDAFVTKAKWKGDRRQLEDSLLRRLNSVKFNGTIHCEASLMGLFVAHVEGKLSSPSDAVFKNLLGTSGTERMSYIGVNKKCCWCCSWLANHLRQSPQGIDFCLAGSHGVVLPWVLPTVGISLEIAEELRQALFKELVSLIENRTSHLPDSQTSSPAGSAGGSLTGEDVELLSFVQSGAYKQVRVEEGEEMGQTSQA